MNLDKNLFKSDYISEAREILDSLDDIAIEASKEKALIKNWYETMKEEYCNNSDKKCEFYFDNENEDSVVFPTAVYYINGF